MGKRNRGRRDRIRRGDSLKRLINGGLGLTIRQDSLSPELERGDEKIGLGNRLLKHCSGQPHSIIMLAGLLAMKKSLAEWQNFEDKVIKEAEGSQPNLYALCYEDLAPHLKECFLYLAKFPENTEISTRKLYNLWIAAGLIRLKDDGKKRKESGGEVEKPMENVAASYLNELVQRGMVQVGKRGLDGRICTFHLQITLRSFCVEKADEKGFHQAELSASALDGRGATGRIWKCGLQVPLQSLCLGKQREELVHPVDQPRPSAQASKEIEHLAVYLNQSDMKIPYEPAPTDDPLKSLLFFPEISTTGDDNWQQCFRKICNYFCFLRILDLEGMQMIKEALPVEVGNLSQLRYFSLKGTNVSNLPTEIKQLTCLQTLDLRVAEGVSFTIPSDSFTFHYLTHLFLPDSFSMSPPSKLQLGGLDHLQTLANLHMGNVSLDCMSELKNLRRILINDIQAVNELDEKLKSKGATIDLSIRGKILNRNAMILSSFQYLSKVTIKGKILGPLCDGMFPKCLKELTLKHTALVGDPIPVLQQLPGLTYLCFDHGSFLGKKMTFSLGFSGLTHLTLRLLSNLEELDMTAAYHLQHVKPLIIDCWQLEVKLPTGAEIQVGPLCHHPFMDLLLPLHLQAPSLEVAADNDELRDGNDTLDAAAETI